MNIDWTDPLLVALALGVVAVFVLWRLLRAVAVLSGLDARLSSLSDTQN